MNFNTIILYDIENLIGGYTNKDMFSNLSLKDIYDEILIKNTGGIAIQRAYANWSDPRLNMLRGDIIELGIDPVQMFGFGRGPSKNASDIQLVIDAVEIALTKPAIDTYVIVSGDGGFATLAKKLHEYGNKVIGCAYKKTTSRVFKAVCDDFIWVGQSNEDFTQSVATSKFTDPILAKYARKYQGLTTSLTRDQVFNEAIQVLEFFTQDKDARYLLKNIGINISILSQALAYRVKEFDYRALGFAKFVDFIRYITAGNKVKLVCKPPSEYRLLLESSSLKDYEDISPITELGDIHTVENYKILLSKAAPCFRLPSAEIIFNIAHYLSENRSQYQAILMGDIIEQLSDEFDYEQNDIKSCLMSFVSAGCFTKEPEDAKLFEQHLSFVPQASEETVSKLKDEMDKKLRDLLGSVVEKHLSEFFR